ncbi:hypothetical protein HDE_11204 [Halotydeus destructor]|nr:hypothetical protein HDE_11204 [Halotydeus destructor]
MAVCAKLALIVLTVLFYCSVAESERKKFVDWRARSGVSAENIVQLKAAIYQEIHQCEICAHDVLRGKRPFTRFQTDLTDHTYEIYDDLRSTAWLVNNYMRNQTALGHLSQSEADELQLELSKITAPFTKRMWTLEKRLNKYLEVKLNERDSKKAEQAVTERFKILKHTLLEDVQVGLAAVIDQLASVYGKD